MQKINIFWFKRDLRIIDNVGLYDSVKSKYPTLLIYVFEPVIINEDHYHNRHDNFVKQSLIELNNNFDSYKTKIHVFEGEIKSIFTTINKYYSIVNLYSMQETGLQHTYLRDIGLKKWCDKNNIVWFENINNGVFRGLKNRNKWREKWAKYMMTKIEPFRAKSSDFINLPDKFELKQKILSSKIIPNVQAGGTKNALQYFNSFLADRHKKYQQSISKPHNSRYHTGRISPYLAWGNISIRYVWQIAKKLKQENKVNKFQINAFTSRLRWQAHFIQKFEMESKMQFLSINRGYHKIIKIKNEKKLNAWKNGKTGYPIVDASMRCLVQTGFLNFRMRALIVSFLTHHLWIAWQEGAVFLAKNFLDFEPGIHYPQIQMQAGETGINMLRIYNPTKNAIEHDKNAEFIKKWVPEISNIEGPLIFEPWKMTEIDQKSYDCKLGEDYPYPIVDIKKSYKNASNILWSMKNNKLVRSESKRILNKHTLSNRKNIMDT